MESAGFEEFSASFRSVSSALRMSIKEGFS